MSVHVVCWLTFNCKSLIAFHIPLHSSDMSVSKQIRSTKNSHGLYVLIVGQTRLMFAWIHMRIRLRSIIQAINRNKCEGSFTGLPQRIIQYSYIFQQTTAEEEKQRNNLYLQLSETKLRWISTERNHIAFSLSPHSTRFFFQTRKHTHTHTLT